MLVAVVVVTMTVFGTFSIASVLDFESEPFVEIEGTLDTDGLTLTHAGGDNLAVSGLTVYVSNDTTRPEVDFESGTLTGDGDDRFEPGERWTNDSTLPTGDRLTVVLAHEPSNSVVFRGRTNL